MALLDFQAETPKKYYKLNDTFVCLIGVQAIEVAEVSDFVDFLATKRRKSQEKKKPRFGSGKGMFVMKPDFDEPLDDFKEYMH